jgi:hypothetical protein
VDGAVQNALNLAGSLETDVTLVYVMERRQYERVVFCRFDGEVFANAERAYFIRLDGPDLRRATRPTKQQRRRGAILHVTDDASGWVMRGTALLASGEVSDRRERSPFCVGVFRSCFIVTRESEEFIAAAERQNIDFIDSIATVMIRSLTPGVDYAKPSTFKLARGQPFPGPPWREVRASG